jgi:hypothetical protein
MAVPPAAGVASEIRQAHGKPCCCLARQQAVIRVRRGDAACCGVWLPTFVQPGHRTAGSTALRPALRLLRGLLAAAGSACRA